MKTDFVLITTEWKFIHLCRVAAGLLAPSLAFKVEKHVQLQSICFIVQFPEKQNECLGWEKKSNAIMGGVHYLSKPLNSQVRVHGTIKLLQIQASSVLWLSKRTVFKRRSFETWCGGTEEPKLRKILLSPYLGYIGASDFFSKSWHLT